MTNNIRVVAKYQGLDDSWYLDIIQLIYSNGNLVTQDGTLYFKQTFTSKEQAYDFAKSYLSSIGISQEIINNEIDYE